MPIAVKLLLAFSRDPGTSDYAEGHSEWNQGNALSILCRVFPDFLRLAQNKEILDFGCGEGAQSIALAQAGARRVVGVDTNRETLRKAVSELDRLGLASKVEFISDLPSGMHDVFDLVISQNSMEHFPDPVDVLQRMRALIKPDGRLLITFGPPWYAPYGSHMQFFTKIPWVNLLFSEATVMSVRGRFRSDGACRYEEVESGLNKMSVGKFERLLRDLGLNAEYSRYECVKGLNFLAGLPVLRELFVNHISVIITKQPTT
ncbi:MAG: class I SAM-dependent methyltransferase [Thermomicrobiales bacterium]|nr:MAG: class I SAM-dependent methyltransferase [Thermomicrobiales bacterium]